ncbi:hypothetical protein Mycsm_03388 [Mycobacterium sp. JS623]|uniref:hypothetical protein n=1 Tax=Mycobacterium sp. JS623 TaxID=212767 RepID=UPI0002A5563C|nr:hypothetical protein [Mycobacterium sp. JS623]AGB23689.1 hypothetical protein Mycsm_03388 [Mycobacterium sp. JS623]
MKTLRRSQRYVVLALTALIAVLAVAGGLLWLHDRRAGEVHVQGEPMTDAEAAAQVVASAKQIVEVAQLRDASGGYAFVSCQDANEPPYQATVYMNFRLPQSNSVKYLRDVAASLVAHGWAPAASTSEHFGQKLTRNGVTAIFYRSVNETDFATMRLYGECRNTADHRSDNPVWREVTDQLG